jgi:hypothetical protein
MHRTRERLHISTLDTEQRAHGRRERVVGVVQEQQRKRTDALEIDEPDSMDSDSDDAGMDGGKGSILYSVFISTSEIHDFGGMYVLSSFRS